MTGDRELYLRLDPDVVPRVMANLRRSAAEQIRAAITTGTVPHSPSGGGLRRSILHARKVAGWERIAVDRDDDLAEHRTTAEQIRRQRNAELDAQLAEHDELLHLHPADGIPRAFLLEHAPYEGSVFAWRELFCRGCPEVYQNDGDTEPAEWPCGPWQLVNERTPR